MMDKLYQPALLEKKWYHHWEKAGYFSPHLGKDSYAIALPPPNVTGTLHMGHAFQDTLMDALIRYHRMQQYQTLWQGGMDHAGIATQMVVERQLQMQGISKHDLGRTTFTQKVWEWKAQSGNTISGQMRRLGASIDWSRERFTMDEAFSQAVHSVFIQLYEENLIYRGQRLVNWDPVLHTAISDLEVIVEEEEGTLWHIRYPIVESNENEFLIIATTRPETLLGDVAVAVHPEDPRYQKWIGKSVLLPLCKRKIPIIADPFVEREFGTGCVKITPAHDFTDYEVGKRHALPLINIFTQDAIINHNAPPAYQNLTRFAARKKIIADLQKEGWLVKEEPHRLKIPRGDRTGEIIEPFLTYQWFLNVAPLAQPAIDAVKNKQIEFVPENWTKTYFEWMNHIQDWCISRQLWWGHRIPAWYDENGNIYVGKDEQTVRKKHALPPELPLAQETDVLDTWFSSALWPFATLGWPEKTNALASFYPTSVLVTGFDIIFFWVARMIMIGIKFMGDIPFHKVYVHGLIQDSYGQKMSKSKGNIIDPIDLIDGISLENLIKKRTQGLMQPQLAPQIEKQTKKEFPQGIPSFGTDALRFSFCALATHNRHIRFDLARIESSRNFCNKLWNAARFVILQLENQDLGSTASRQWGVAEKWIWSAWQKAKKTVHDHFANYRFDIIAQTLYDFVWYVYCDWYLEFSKATLSQSDGDPAFLQGTRFTLIAILEEIVRAIHPIMPFISEEIWQKLNPVLDDSYATTSSIMMQHYPIFESNKLDEESEKSIAIIQKFVLAIRNIRGEMQISFRQALPVYCCHGSKTIVNIVNHNALLIQKLAKLETIEMTTPKNCPPLCVTALVEDLELFIPLKDIIDLEKEEQRLQKEKDKLQKEINQCNTKLNKAAFLEKAPPVLVAQEKERLNQYKMTLEKLQRHLDKILALRH